MPQDSCAELALSGGAMRYDARRLAHPGSYLFDPRAPANDAVDADMSSHPPGCGCAFHLRYRNRKAGAGG